MSASQSRAKAVALTGLVIAMTLATAYLLRPAVPGATPAATPSPLAPASSAPMVAAPAGGAGAASAGGLADTPTAPAPPAPVALAAADARQAGKIARGLAERGGSGLLVSAAPPGSVTDQLRLEPGDIVVTVNGEPVSSIDDFVRIYRAQGTPTQLTILRKGREIHLH